MDAKDLLKTWPDWQRAGAETILASPAWRLPARLGAESSGELTVTADLPDDPIVLSVTLDGEAHTLVLGDAAAYPDLHLLWKRRAGLPAEVLLALIEKECGDLFSLIENVMRRQFALKGLADSVPAELRVFLFTCGETALRFGLDLTPALVTQLGTLDALDPAHPSIRALTRPYRAVEGRIALAEDEQSALVPGAYVLLPESFDAERRWATEDELAASEGALAVACGTTEISFGAVADGTFPEIPPLGEVEILLRGSRVARAAVTQVGDVTGLLVKA